MRILKKYIEENLKKKFIRSSKFSAKYSILFASKKNDKLRLCVDYRQLNNITVKNRYTLSLIFELQNRIEGVKIFTLLDLKKIYHHIRMKKGEKWKTVFRTRYEHYKYTIMLFELTNASASLQSLMNDTFKKFLNEFVIIYLNDILIYSKNEEQHHKHVEKVLEKIQKINFFVKPKKCAWDVTEVEFLEHIIITEEIRMNPKKIKTIMK